MNLLNKSLSKQYKNGIVMVLAVFLGLSLMIPVVSSGAGSETPITPMGAPIENEIETITLQPNATDGKDTYISNDTVFINPSWNFGSDNSLYFGAVNTEPLNGLIEFDLPVNIGNLYQATLSSYCRNIVGTPGNFSVYGVSNNWEEGTGGAAGPAGIANWSYRLSPLVPWTTPGGDYFTTTNSYIDVGQIDVWYSWDVTSIVQNWRSGAWSNYGFFIKSENPPNVGSNYAAFHSSDYTADTNLTPKLTLTYAAEIDPPVPAQVLNEDDPTKTISLDGRGSGSLVHVSESTTVSSPLPFDGTTYDSTHIQCVYTPEQIGGEGVIKRLSLERSTAIPQVGTFNNLVISMAHTNRTNVTSSFTNFDGYLIEVFSEPTVELNSSNGDPWLHFDLNDNFTFDSAHNLLVDIQWNGDNGQTVMIGFNDSHSEPMTVYQEGANPIDTVTNLLVAEFTTDVVDNAVIDVGKTSNSYPLSAASSQMRLQMLYNYTFINESGIIDKLRFQSNQVSMDWAIMENLSIKLGHSQNDSLDSNMDWHTVGSLVEVLNETTINVSTSGRPEWIEFEIDDVFNYNGVDNLIIDFSWNVSSGLDSGVDLAVNNTATYICRAYAFNKYAATATSMDTRQYNLQTIFLESANLTWSASASDNSLFTVGISNNNLLINPQPDAFGTGSINLKLTNSNGLFVSQVIPVTISPVNDAPEITGPSTIECTEDIDKVVNVSSHLSDIDNTIEELTITTDSDYATVDGHNITFNYPEGVFTENVTITVKDDGGLTASVIAVVTVTPVNDPPVLTGYVNTLTCDATLPKNYVVSPDDEETPDNVTVFANSQYATVSGSTITFLYPKGVGSEVVTIYVVDDTIYGSQNNISYILTVTINDHPEIISNTPEGVNVTVPVTTTIVLTFDMAMNATTTEAAFGLSFGGTDVNGTFSWTVNNTVMTFTPTTNLTNGKYDVSIGTGARSDLGITMLSSLTWNFTAALGDFDGDGDGMADQWEIDNGLNPTIDDSAADKDGDGMPNLYEFQNDLNPSLNDAEADADGDGATNLEEYEAGTDPRDPEDKPSAIPLFLIVVVVIVIIVLVVVATVASKAKTKGGRPPEDDTYSPEDSGEQEFYDEPDQDLPLEEEVIMDNEGPVDISDDVPPPPPE